MSSILELRKENLRLKAVVAAMKKDANRRRAKKRAAKKQQVRTLRNETESERRLRVRRERKKARRALEATRKQLEIEQRRAEARKKKAQLERIRRRAARLEEADGVALSLKPLSPEDERALAQYLDRRTQCIDRRTAAKKRKDPVREQRGFTVRHDGHGVAQVVSATRIRLKTRGGERD